MFNFIFRDSFKNLHSGHYTEYAVVVSAVFNRIDVRRHNNALCIFVCSLKRCVNVCHVVYFNLRADFFHTADKFVSCHNRLFRERITRYTAVARIAEFAESFDFVTHTFFTALIHKYHSFPNLPF